MILPRPSMLQTRSLDSRGSRVAIILNFPPSWSDYPTGDSSEILVFDLHPLAAANNAEGGVFPTQEWISDYYTEDETSVFRGVVRSTLPYRVARAQPHDSPELEEISIRNLNLHASHDRLFVSR